MSSMINIYFVIQIFKIVYDYRKYCAFRRLRCLSECDATLSQDDVIASGRYHSGQADGPPPQIYCFTHGFHHTVTVILMPRHHQCGGQADGRTTATNSNSKSGQQQKPRHPTHTSSLTLCSFLFIVLCMLVIC